VPVVKLALINIWLISGNSHKFAPAMNERRERIRSLLLLTPPYKKQKRRKVMNPGNLTKIIEDKLVELLADDPGYFLVEMSIKPTNNIKVFVDADQGADINHLSKINRALYKWLEESFFPEGDFSIEVSSPGLDEPLKLDRQYAKNTGRFVEVILKNGLKKEGKLLGVSGNELLVLEEKGKGKKKELIEHKILKEEIKSTRIQIKF
jgi:ribosome maturation factor RimP